MSLGTSSFTLVSGAGRSAVAAQALSRQVVLAGCSPKGTANTLYKPQSTKAAIDTLGAGALLDAVLHLFGAEGAPPPMALVITPTNAGGKSAVAHVGPGTGTFAVTVASHIAVQAKVSTAGAIATMKIRLSYDGGTTYGDEIASADSGSGSWVYRIPGTYLTATFAAGTYVLNSTYAWSTSSVVDTVGGSGIDTVTATASPVDTFDVKLTVVAGGAAATCSISPSLDGGISTLPTMAIPSGGVVVLPGTGLVLTLTGSLTADDTYTFIAGQPGYSTSDLAAAITAMRADVTAPVSCRIFLIDQPSSVTGAFSAGSTLNTALGSAFTTDNLDWRGQVNIPCSEGALGGDIIVSGGTAARATSAASTDIRAAREGATYNRVGMCAGAHRVESALTAAKLLRPTSLVLAKRYAENTPKQGVANREGQPLDVYAIGRNELTASTTLHDVEIDSLQTIRGEVGAWLAVQSGGFGFRHLTTDAAFQDADFMRIVDAVIAAVRPVAQRQVGARPAANSDGTISTDDAKRIQKLLQKVADRAAGMTTGGAFREPQLSSLVVTVDPSSQVGASPHELVVLYDARSLGFISSTRGSFRVSGAEV